MEDYNIVFESENILYVELTEKLIPDYLEMVNDPEVASKISHKKRTFSYEDEQAWIMNKKENNAKCYSMIEKSTGDFIGNIEITKVVNNIGELGISITVQKQNKHYGTEAMKAIIDYGYKAFSLSGFDLRVFSTNERAIRCYKNVGFIEDGYNEEKEVLHMRYHH